MTPQERLHKAAVNSIGLDMGGNIPDIVACAASINNIHYNEFGKFINSYGTASTWHMREALWLKSFKLPGWRYAKVSLWQSKPGDIWICATGRGNGSMPGHVGIVTTGQKIISNNSYTGRMDTHYTFDEWRSRYEKSGGFTTEAYRLIKA